MATKKTSGLKAAKAPASKTAAKGAATKTAVKKSVAESAKKITVDSLSAAAAKTSAKRTKGPGIGH